MRRRLLLALTFSPTRPASIERAVAQGAGDMALVGAPAKGLPALEWLLWTHRLGKGSPACAYARRVADEIADEAAALAEAFAMPRDGDDEAAAAAAYAQVLNEFVAGIEALRWAQIERPLKEGRRQFPRAASRSTAAAWAARWDALRRLSVHQAEHDDDAQRARAPVLALFDGNTLRTAASPPLAGYGGDIAATNAGFVVSAPRQGGLELFDGRGRRTGHVALDQACALVVAGPTLYAGGGDFALVMAPRPGCVRKLQAHGQVALGCRRDLEAAGGAGAQAKAAAQVSFGGPFEVRFADDALDELERLFDVLLDRATTLEDAEQAQQAIDAIRDVVVGHLARTPYSFRKAGSGSLRRELIVPFGSAGYVALSEIEPAQARVVVLAVRHQREDDYH